MRLIGLVLALGAMAWVLYQAAGGDNADSAIPEAHQASLEKAQSLESSVQATIEQRLQEAEQEASE